MTQKVSWERHELRQLSFGELLRLTAERSLSVLERLNFPSFSVRELRKMSGPAREPSHVKQQLRPRSRKALNIAFSIPRPRNLKNLAA